MTAPADRRRVDRAPGQGLVEEHGEELVRLAVAITGRTDTACGVVAGVLRTALSRPGPRLGRTATESELVSAVVGACRVVTGTPAHPAMRFNSKLAWIARTSSHQRLVVALYVHGGRTPTQIAALSSLPLEMVCWLLLSAIEELADDGGDSRSFAAPPDAPR